MVVAAVLAAALTGCGHSSQGGFGRLTVDGQVQVTPLHGATHAGQSGDVLQAGDRIGVATGQASVRLVSGGNLQLRTGSQVILGRTSRLSGGAVLIQPGGQPLAVAAQTSTLVVPSGAAQLAVGSAGAFLMAKVYVGTSRLDIAGNPSATIAAPRQINLTPDTRLPVPALPLQYKDADSWDHLYLADAEVVSIQLGAAVNGFNAQVPANQGKDAGFYQHLVPSLSGQSDFASAFSTIQHARSTSLATVSKPGDYLIASVIAVRGSRGTFEDRLNNELVFAAQGAPWGFVAYDQGVRDLTGVLNDVSGAIGRASIPVNNGSPASQIAIGPPPTAATTPTTRPSHGAPSTTTTTNPRQPHPTTTTTTTTPPLIQLPVPVLPGALGSILNPLLDPLIQALNNILAGRH